MWGFVIYLMRLADYVTAKRNKFHCTQCGRVCNDERELDVHIRTDHPRSM